MATGGKGNPTISRIADPSPNIISQLEGLNRQINLLTANIIGEPALGSVTAVTRNSSSKLFVIGFIPPSTPVNHVPIETVPRTVSTESDISTTAGGAEAAGEEGIAEAKAAGLVDEETDAADPTPWQKLTTKEKADTIELSERNEAEVKQNRAIMAYSGVTRLESSDPNVVRLRKNIRAADGKRRRLVDLQVAALRAQIEAVQNTPPLILIHNPREFTRNYEQAVDNSVKGRFGHIVHSWLERPMKINASGVSAGQYVFDAGGSGGLTSENRVHSISYYNLMSLLMMYKNNGILFTGAEARAEQGIPSIAISLYIYYDNHIYIGSFDDFEVSDNAENPFRLEYTFKFNVRYDLDVDSSHLVESTVFSPDPRTNSGATLTS